MLLSRCRRRRKRCCLADADAQTHMMARMQGCKNLAHGKADAYIRRSQIYDMCAATPELLHRLKVVYNGNTFQIYWAELQLDILP